MLPLVEYAHVIYKICTSDTLQALLSMRLDVQLRCCQNFEAASQGAGRGEEC